MKNHTQKLTNRNEIHEICSASQKHHKIHILIDGKQKMGKQNVLDYLSNVLLSYFHCCSLCNMLCKSSKEFRNVLKYKQLHDNEATLFVTKRHGRK